METAIPEANRKPVQEVKAKATAKAGKGATQSILSLIGKSEKGISEDRIMNQSGIGRQTVNEVLNRVKKEGKIKVARRGVYVKA